MRFAISHIWRESSDHHTDCYFCMVDPTKPRKEKKAPPTEHPDIPSPIAPVSHNATDLPLPQPPSKDPAEESSEDSEKEGASSSSAFVMRRPHRLDSKQCPYYQGRVVAKINGRAASENFSHCFCKQTTNKESYTYT